VTTSSIVRNCTCTDMPSGFSMCSSYVLSIRSHRAASRPSGAMNSPLAEVSRAGWGANRTSLHPPAIGSIPSTWPHSRCVAAAPTLWHRHVLPCWILTSSRVAIRSNSQKFGFMCSTASMSRPLSKNARQSQYADHGVDAGTMALTCPFFLLPRR